RGVRADPQRERQSGDGGDDRRGAERADGEAEILHAASALTIAQDINGINGDGRSRLEPSRYGTAIFASGRCDSHQRRSAPRRATLRGRRGGPERLALHQPAIGRPLAHAKDDELRGPHHRDTDAGNRTSLVNIEPRHVVRSLSRRMPAPACSRPSEGRAPTVAERAEQWYPAVSHRRWTRRRKQRLKRPRSESGHHYTVAAGRCMHGTHHRESSIDTPS